MLKPAALSAFLLLPLLFPAQDRIVGGPYAVHVTGKSATIGWVVQSGEVMVDGTRAIPVLRSEKISMTGLKPGKTVHYTIPGGTSSSFKTAPAPGAPFEAVVFGDTRTRHDLHRRIVQAIGNVHPDFVLHTGDLVTDGLDTEQWPRFFDIERQMLAQTAFYPVLGNHERNSPRFYEFFDVSTPYYSFDWGDAHFVLLNSDLGNSALSQQARDSFWAEQLRWLDEDLARAEKAAYRFVVMHHPPFTAVKSRQAGNTPVKAMVPVFEKRHVTAVFTGHDHNYQHHLHNGVHYVVTGGGGAPLYPVDAPIEGTTLKVESTEHFVRLVGSPSMVKVEAIALDGRTLDSFDLKP